MVLYNSKRDVDAPDSGWCLDVWSWRSGTRQPCCSVETQHGWAKIHCIVSPQGPLIHIQTNTQIKIHKNTKIHPPCCSVGTQQEWANIHCIASQRGPTHIHLYKYKYIHIHTKLHKLHCRASHAMNVYMIRRKTYVFEQSSSCTNPFFCKVFTTPNVQENILTNIK